MNIDDTNISSIAQMQAQKLYTAQYKVHLQKAQRIESQYNAQRDRLGKLTLVQLKKKQELISSESNHWKELEKTYKEIGLATTDLNNQLLNTRFSVIEESQLSRINNLKEEIINLNSSVNSGSEESIELLNEKLRLLQREEQSLARVTQLFKDEGMQLNKVKAAVAEQGMQQAEVNKQVKWTAKLFSQLKEKIVDIASEPLVFGATAALSLRKNLEGAYGTTKEMFTEMGLSIGNVIDLSGELWTGWKAGLKFGASWTDNWKIMKEIGKQFGSLKTAHMSLVTDAIELQKFYGMSEDRAVELLKTFSNISDGTSETVKSLKAFTIEFSNISNVIPSTVMADLAANSEFIAKYTSDGGKDMIKFAVHARQLGLEMSDVASATEGLLDIESSIRGELEASVLLGKQINLQKARELMFAGKTDEAMVEMVKQAGSLEEFNSMNVIQRKALAGAMGLSVDKLQTMVANQENLGNLTGEYNKKNNMTAKIMTGIGSTIKRFATKENIGFWVSLAGNISEVTQGLGAFSVMAKKSGSLILDFVTFIPRMIAKLIMWSAAKMGLNAATAAEVSLHSANVAAINSETTAQMGLNVAKGAGKKGGLMSMNPTNLIKGAAALVIMSGALWVTAKALQEFVKVDWKQLALAGVAIVGLAGLMAGISLLWAPILIGAGVFAAMGVSLLIFGTAMSAAGYGAIMLANGLSQLMSINFGHLLTMSSVFTTLAISLAALSASMIAIGTVGAVLSPLIKAIQPEMISSNKISATKQSNKESTNVVNKENIDLLKSLNNKLEQLIVVTSKTKNINIDGKKINKAIADLIPSYNQA